MGEIGKVLIRSLEDKARKLNKEEKEQFAKCLRIFQKAIIDFGFPARLAIVLMGATIVAEGE
jgi:hypothetical protein